MECQSYGDDSDLVVIDGPPENLVLERYIEQVAASIGQFWIGGTLDGVRCPLFLGVFFGGEGERVMEVVMRALVPFPPG